MGLDNEADTENCVKDFLKSDFWARAMAQLKKAVLTSVSLIPKTLMVKVGADSLDICMQWHPHAHMCTCSHTRMHNKSLDLRKEFLTSKLSKQMTRETLQNKEYRKITG